MLRLPAYTVYLIIGAVSAICLQMVYPMLALYYVQFAHLNPFQLVLVGTSMELTAFIFEVPTGVVADRFSRRLSVIIGQALFGLSLLIMAWTPSFTAIILGAITLGLGSTFLSGALSAWIADELGTERLTQALLRYQQIRQLAGILGIILGMIIANYHVPLVLLCGGWGLILLSIFMIVNMPENHFHARSHAGGEAHSGLRNVLQTTLNTVRMSGIVRLLLLVSLFTGTFSEGIDRLWEAHLLLDITLPFGLLGQQLSPAIWFGAISLGIQLWSTLGVEVLIRRLEQNSWLAVGQALRLMTIGIALMTLIFGLTTNIIVAILAILLIQGLRNLQAPLREAWLNAHTPSQARATVLSVASQADAIGQVAGGPILGGIATLASIPVAMLVNAILVIPALLLYGRAMENANMPLPGDPTHP